MVSIAALVLVALATPFVAVVCFGVLVRYGTDPPRSILALSALAFATPGVLGVALLDPTAPVNATLGILLTTGAGLGLLDPRLVPTRDHYEYLCDRFLGRTRDRIDPADEPATTWIALRVLAAAALLFGLYLTATALVPEQTATATIATTPVLATNAP